MLINSPCLLHVYLECVLLPESIFVFCMFLGLCSFYQVIQCVGVQLFIAFSCIPFYFCLIVSNASILILDLNNLSLVFFDRKSE